MPASLPSLRSRSNYSKRVAATSQRNSTNDDIKQKKEALRRKLEKAKEELSRKELPAERNIGQQKPNEPEKKPQPEREERATDAKK